MPSFQLVFQIILGLGPYFSVAIALAFFLGLFLPWGVMHPQKWLFFYIFGIALLPFGGGGPDGSGSLYKQLTWGVLYLLCLIIIIRSRKDINAPKLKIPPELLLLYGYVFISIAWSDYQVSSLKRYTLLIGLMLIAIISCRRALQEQSFTSLVEKPLAFFMLCGAIFAIASPGIAFDSDGALRALTSHKNTWGQFMLLCSLVFFVNIMSRKRVALNIPLLVTALTLLYLSKSATSLLAFLLSTCFALTVHILSRKNAAGKIILLLIALTASVAFLIYCILYGKIPFEALIDLIFSSMDKSSTLTGRTQLWAFMEAEIIRHPWFGTGYGGFWVGLDGPAGTLVRRLDWGPPTQAHSGYIDGLNEIGVVGMLIFSYLIATHIYRCFRLYSIGMHSHFILHSAIAISFLIKDYAESSLIQGTNLWWIIMTCSILEVSNRLRLQQAPKNMPRQAFS